MATLSAHMNVWETCVQILLRSGWHVRATEDGESYLWHASKGEFELTAANPIELLGLTAIHSELSPRAPAPYWWAANTIKGRNEVDRVLSEAGADDGEASEE